MTDWTEISFEVPKKTDAVKAAPVLKSCPKCGKPLAKGGHFHVKHCKDAPNDRYPGNPG
jgi:hypothetical protein